jgi:hypothetical protein
MCLRRVGNDGRSYAAAATQALTVVTPLAPAAHNLGVGGGDVTLADLETKQDPLSAGTNITFDANNVTSSTSGGGGDVTQKDLNAKHDLITTERYITPNNIIFEVNSEPHTGARPSVRL